MRKSIWWAVLGYSLAVLISSQVDARNLGTSGQRDAAFTPAYSISTHRVGNMIISVTNHGTFGNGYSEAGLIDFFTGLPAPSCQFPAGSNQTLLFGGGIWIGGLTSEWPLDTLVSLSADGWQLTTELRPDEAPLGHMQCRVPPEPGFISDFDLIGVYADTTGEASHDWTGRPHHPLNVEITQTSHSWDEDGFDDFIIMRYQVHNIGSSTIDSAYIGFFVDADIRTVDDDYGAMDDISGFMLTAERADVSCPVQDTLFLAWTADNDGNLGTPTECPHVAGLRLLAPYWWGDNYSFNWWISSTDASWDFGPRERPFTGRWKEDYRDFGTGGTGTPEGDANKYYQMRNLEVDYDQAYTATITPGDTLWMQPNQTLAPEIAKGFDTRYLLSVGPFTIDPGQSVPFAVAYVAGANLHYNEFNYSTYMPYEPELFYGGLDFSDLTHNALMAQWTYDNPGLDTDGDGFAGDYVICDTDTIWTSGDGIPDLRPPDEFVCCHGIRGNVNGDQDELINIADMTHFIDYLFDEGPALPCDKESDLNADTLINIADMTYLISYIFESGPAPVICY